MEDGHGNGCYLSRSEWKIIAYDENDLVDAVSFHSKYIFLRKISGLDLVVYGSFLFMIVLSSSRLNLRIIYITFTAT